jgi:gluconate 2-dehydrogenase gamma chain
MSLDETTASTAASESMALTFLSDLEARTVEAVAERIIPDDGTGTGATEAGVVYYIDRTLSGFSTNLQHVYRVGLRELEGFCQERFSASFVDLSPDQQDGVVRELLGPEVHTDRPGLLAEEDRSQVGSEDETTAKLSEEDRSQVGSEEDTTGRGAGRRVLARLLAVIREHAVEGFFCDPAYGGNRNGVGWKLVGFPGAYWGYTAKQMARGFDGTKLPIKTLSDLRAQLKELPDNSTYYRNEEQ